MGTRHPPSAAASSSTTYVLPFLCNYDLLFPQWVRSKIPQHNIKNFKTDWNDGRALASLVNVIG